MPDANPPTALSTVVLCLAGLFILFGVVWFGISGDGFVRQWQDLTGRTSGPMTFRFLLQPLMATVAAVHDGIVDARLGRRPYLWTVLSDPVQRRARLLEGLNATARIILLGIGMDVIYQLKVFGTFYPVEALIIAVVLAFIPYLLIRGPVTRLAHWWQHRNAQRGSS